MKPNTTCLSDGGPFGAGCLFTATPGEACWSHRKVHGLGTCRRYGEHARGLLRFISSGHPVQEDFGRIQRMFPAFAQRGANRRPQRKAFSTWSDVGARDEATHMT